MTRRNSLDWPEYLVFGLTLLFSISIGIYYGFFGSKQKTTQEYLLANRSMAAWPVSLSLICSAVSAITLLGNPVEVYLYGTQYMLVVLCFIPFTLSLSYLYLPLYFNLGVNSAYEYIELRFHSKVRLAVSILAVLQLIVSMAIAVYAPSLAINQVAGLDTRLTTAAIYFVCIFYSSLGGLKAVLWTDVFQAFIMLVSLVIVIVKGVVDLGGFGVIWERAADADRIQFLNFDADPRTRHTVWTSMFAGYFFWLPTYAATQIQVQRFLSMPDIATARKSLVMNAIGLTVVVLLCCFTGLVIFARYHDCDPVTHKDVSSTDQLLPLFVSETVGEIPGLMGVFIAGITCASMSTLSSGLSALTSITTYDYISKLWPKLSDAKLSRLSKINCFLLGLLSYSFLFIVENMGSILPATSSILGIFAGPVLGLFSLGMFFPWVNSKGAVSGMVIAFALMITFIIGNQIASTEKLLPDQRLELLVTGCSNTTFEASTTESSPNFPGLFSDRATNWKDISTDDSGLIRLLSVSYLWYSGMGCILSVFFGLVISTAFNYKVGNQAVREEYISPPIVKLWRRVCPAYDYVYFTSANTDVHSVAENDISIALKEAIKDHQNHVQSSATWPEQVIIFIAATLDIELETRRTRN